jgi:hypothetical protein
VHLATQVKQWLFMWAHLFAILTEFLSRPSFVQFVIEETLALNSLQGRNKLQASRKTNSAECCAQSYEAQFFPIHCLILSVPLGLLKAFFAP